MSAVALTHNAMIRRFIAQSYKCSRRNKRQRVKDRETNLQKLRLQPLHSLGKNFRPTSRGGHIEFCPPPECSTHIYRQMSWHDTSPDKQFWRTWKFTCGTNGWVTHLDNTPHNSANQSITTSMSWMGQRSNFFQIQHPLDRQTSPIWHSLSQERRSRPVALPLQHRGIAWRTYVMINGLMQWLNHH